MSRKDKQINGSYFYVSYSLDEELTSLWGVTVETDIAAGISPIHLASTTEVNCSSCRQQTPTCAHISQYPRTNIGTSDAKSSIIQVPDTIGAAKSSLDLAMDANPQHEDLNKKMNIIELIKVWEGRKEVSAKKDHSIVAGIYATKYPRTNIGTDALLFV